MTSSETWDLVVVGAGPAGAAAALGALQEHPEARVLLLDRAEFPRDKVCGDGIAPHVLDVLASLGASDLVESLLRHHRPITTLELSLGQQSVVRPMQRPALVVPRAEFDAGLVEAAVRAGSVLRRHRVREVRAGQDHVVVDDTIRASVVVAADGARSQVRRALGMGPAGPVALGLRGYAPTRDSRAGRQVIRFGQDRRPSYAWAFDRGDGWSNVGYGEVLSSDLSAPSHRLMVERLEVLLPGSSEGAHSWRGHHLPLSGARWVHPPGRVLLVGDAAGLVNPLTGEGIYYAVATGAIAGRVAGRMAGRLPADPAPSTGVPTAADPGAVYGRQVRRLLRLNLLSTAVASRLVVRPLVLSAGLRAADSDQRVFDDLVELGLGPGRLTGRAVAGLVRAAASGRRGTGTPQDL
ncbi:NAD(P)/FAD-dependent oxidoreductase [Pedococcus sp. KACC 23699]|uniref:NAD(P)/FAD-dependent oxidoreductase n=1 Tax=Pedococcus sp. KACC 23699 TaxID=3149228 RepID=A0AAU7JTL3_9MICO